MAAPQLLHDDFDVGVALRDVTSDDQAAVTVVLTMRPGERRPDFDAEELASSFPDVRVLVVPGHLTGAITRRLGDEFTVFGGAARVYPCRRPGVPYKAFLLPTHRRPIDELTRTLHDVLRRELRPVERHAVLPRPEQLGGEGRSKPGPSERDSVTLIDTAADAHAFAEHLLNPGRRRPALLVTRRAGAANPLVDLGRVVDEAAWAVDVFEMGTGAVSWEFAQALAEYPGAECYGGAARVYPVGLDWTHDLRASPLRFIWSDDEATLATDRLIRDAFAAARHSGYEPEVAATRTVSGTVAGLVSGRILVHLDGGDTATIWPELVAAGVTAEQVATKGQRVSGALEVGTGRLDVASSVIAPDVALAVLAAGDQVVVRVVAVESELAVLELYPDVQIAVEAPEIIGGRAGVDVRQWLTEGESVVGRLVAAEGAPDEWSLSLLEVDADAGVREVPSLLPGGPAWLAVPPSDTTTAPVAPAAAPAPSPPARPPAPARVAEVAAPAPVARPPYMPASTRVADARVAELESLLADLMAERDAMALQLGRHDETSRRRQEELKLLRTRARELESRVTRAEKQAESAQAKLLAFEQASADRALDAVAFSDPEEQFRYEVQLEWARRIPAAEKRALPMGRFRLGPDFLTTLASQEGRDRSKVVQVVVDVVTGRVHHLPGRQTHQLRTGHGGDDPYLTRPDGATCWRVSLQHKTPQARRLHYWALADGTFELSSVRQHDDIRA